MSEGFLGRWSRRKAGARLDEPERPRRRGRAVPQVPSAKIEDDLEPSVATPAESALTFPVGEEQAGEAGPSQDISAAAPDEEALTEEQKAHLESLPDIEALDYESDYKGFLDDKVPEAIRRRALRRLWSSSPVLANVDGLVDYGEDFTDAATVIEGMQTAYQVGRGMLTPEERAEEAERKLAAEKEAESEEDSDAERESEAEARGELDPQSGDPIVAAEPANTEKDLVTDGNNIGRGQEAAGSKPTAPS